MESADLVLVNDIDAVTAHIELPAGFDGPRWRPSGLCPIEVIDGQHRLWAFEDTTAEDFEIPVVAFTGLDVSWQAYLFWTINITPKRINPSLAYDLYPLLRTEDWLERFEGHPVYRETRAQELTEALWAHPASPWYHKINMLGERREGVTQAAWVRSLLATYVKTWERQESRTMNLFGAADCPMRAVGGLFGAAMGQDRQALPWSRAQQAAFLVLVGRKMQAAIAATDLPWARSLREGTQYSILDTVSDPAFFGQYSLLNTDQGIRGLLHVTNDLCYAKAGELSLEQWTLDEDDATASDQVAVSRALADLEQRPAGWFLEELATCLATYDWRTSGFPALLEEERSRKVGFRGSGGYRELRRQLLRHLSEQELQSVAQPAALVQDILGFNPHG